jgi:hypothetical protein
MPVMLGITTSIFVVVVVVVVAKFSPILFSRTTYYDSCKNSRYSPNYRATFINIDNQYLTHCSTLFHLALPIQNDNP